MKRLILTVALAGSFLCSCISISGESVTASNAFLLAENTSEDGVRTVISLRDEAGMRRGIYDEPALARSLGMRHVTMPLYAGGLDARDIARFAQVLESAEGPIFIHCGVSNSAGGAWAAYLALERGFSADEAIERGEAAGLAKPETIEAVRQLIESASQ